MAAPPAHGPAAGDEDPAAGSPEPDDLPHDEVVAWEPVVTRPDPMTQEDQQALLDAVTDQDGGVVAAGGRPPTRRTTTRRRIRHLATAHRHTRTTGPDRHPRPDPRRRV